jgi:hypothetical protein
VGSLVEELQRDALDNTVDVSSLLRKALVVATKLNLVEFKEWVECELKGYGNKEIPSYRVFQGDLRAWNPYNRSWIPVIFHGRPQVQDQFSTRHERGPIGPLQALVNDSAGSDFQVRLPNSVQATIYRDDDFPMETVLQIGRTPIIKILDAVRNAVLEWSLKLEADGIVGEGLSFSTREKEIAAENSADLRPSASIVINHMENSSIQQGSTLASQSTNAS